MLGESGYERYDVIDTGSVSEMEDQHWLDMRSKHTIDGARPHQ